MKKNLLILSIAIFGISNAQYTKLLDFTGGFGSAGNPEGSLVSDGTFLYGMTKYGGYGTIFKIKTDGTGYSNLFNFASSANGIYPLGALISEGGFLYGMTPQGGTNGGGVILKIKPDGTGYTKPLDFDGAPDGSLPEGSLISDGTFLYGMTELGGTNNFGTIFKIKPDGTGYSKLLDFAGFANGKNPQGSLIAEGGFLYGMTAVGGIHTRGAIFKIKTDGTGYSKLLDFTGANGYYPTGSLISAGGFLYGMTKLGGTKDSGVVFKIKPDGTGYTKLLDFTGVINGSYPRGDFISDGGVLYGMTERGGINNQGVLFKIKPDGTGYAKLLDFDGVANGSAPSGSLISEGGFLYGMTRGGGTNSAGTVFKYSIATGIAGNNAETDFTIYPNPTNGKFTIQFSHIKGGDGVVEIYNMIGEKVYATPNVQHLTSDIIDLSSQPSGIYFLCLKSDHSAGPGRMATQKLIINR